MRAKHDARPRLEMMEVRLVPSALALHENALTDRAHAAEVSRLDHREERAAEMHTKKLDAAGNEQHALDQAAATTKKPASASKSDSNTQSNPLSDFFHSVFGGL